MVGATWKACFVNRVGLNVLSVLPPTHVGKASLEGGYRLKLKANIDFFFIIL